MGSTVRGVFKHFLQLERKTLTLLRKIMCLSLHDVVQNNINKQRRAETTVCHGAFFGVVRHK